MLDQAVAGLVSHEEGWPLWAEECRLGLCFFKPLYVGLGVEVWKW